MSSDPPADTYLWLLSERAACPACGGDLAPAAPGCASCGRRFMQRYRPPQRSATARTLVGAWAIGACGALLALIGALFQVLGITPRTNTDTVLGVLLIGSTSGAIFSAAMAWASLQRHVLALYIGMTLAAVLGVAGFVGGLLLRGPLGLALATGCVAGALALLLMHISALSEFRGEWRRQSFPISANSARGLARAGRTYLTSGLPFLAAQCFARAVGKEPSNAEYFHALGLALLRLRQPQRALAQIERALALEPGNAEFQRSAALARTQPPPQR